MSNFNREIHELMETYSINGVHFEFMGEEEALVIETEISGNLKWENNQSRLHFEVKKGKINTALDDLRNKLLPTGLYPFISKYDREKKFKTPEQLSVIKFQDQYDVLRFQYTHGTEVGITHEDIIKKLKDFDKRYGIEIYGASENWTVVRFKSLPENIEKLADEIIDFSSETLSYIERILSSCSILSNLLPM